MEPVSDDIRQRFLKLVEGLIEHLELTSMRVDIRDRIAALALIDRVLAREKPDDSSRGSAVAKYAPAFQTTNGAHGRAATAGDDARAADREADDRADDASAGAARAFSP